MSSSNHQNSPTHRIQSIPEVPSEPSSPQHHMDPQSSSPCTPELVAPIREEATESPEEIGPASATSTGPSQDTEGSAESVPAEQLAAVTSPPSADPEVPAAEPARPAAVDPPPTDAGTADGQRVGSVWPLPVALASRIPRPRQQQPEDSQEGDSLAELPRSASFRSTEEGQEAVAPPPAWPPAQPQSVLRPHSSRGEGPPPPFPGRLSLGQRSPGSSQQLPGIQISTVQARRQVQCFQRSLAMWASAGSQCDLTQHRLCPLQGLLVQFLLQTCEMTCTLCNSLCPPWYLFCNESHVCCAAEGRLGLASRSSSSAMTPRSDAASLQGDPKRTLGRASSRLLRLASAQGSKSANTLPAVSHLSSQLPSLPWMYNIIRGLNLA